MEVEDKGEEMTDEQQAMMADGLIHVRDVVGPEDQSGLSDTKIKDALWEFYFDVEKTIRWCMEEQDRIKAVQERKDTDYDKDLPIIPPPVINPIESRVPLIVLARSQNIYVNPDNNNSYEEYEYSSSSDTASLSQPMRRPLSRITELTERTEGSPLVPSRQHAPHGTIDSSSMSSLGQIIEHHDYRTPQGTPLMDPNQIPVSPSNSALHRLSYYEPAPSMHSSVTASPPPAPPSVDVPPLDSIPDIPDVMSRSSRPDAVSRSGRLQRPAPGHSGAPPPPSAAPPAKAPSVASKASAPPSSAAYAPPSSATSAPKKSKLSQLASSRASTSAAGSAPGAPRSAVSAASVPRSATSAPRSATSAPRSATSSHPTANSVSSHQTGVTVDGSVRTYPALRPTSSSLRSPTTSTNPSVGPHSPSVGLHSPSVGPHSPYSPSAAPNSPSPTRTSTNSHIRRAIDAAMAQEENEKDNPPTPKAPSSVHSDATAVPAEPEKRQPSKLALLAKAKAAKLPAKGTSILNAPAARKAPTLPEERTEYLTPIANGPTVTTAITTSYQSLYSLADPGRARMGKAPYVAPLPQPAYGTDAQAGYGADAKPGYGTDAKPGYGVGPPPAYGASMQPSYGTSQQPSHSTSPPEKQSKLALKARRAAQERRPQQLEGAHSSPRSSQLQSPHSQLQSPHSQLDEEPLLMRPPIFGSPREGSQATPSTFGSLLVDDEAEAERRRRARKERKRAEGAMSPMSEGTTTPLSDEERDRQRSQREKHSQRRKSKKQAPSIPTFSPPLSFSFDVPSPDDVVLNARKNTGFAKRQSAATSTVSSATSIRV